MFGPFQTEICSAEQLDCVRNIKVDPHICLEKCEGTIIDISKHYFDPVNWQILREILDDYQHYKYPESINITDYYYSFRNKPKLVVISLKTSMFHRIYKVRLKQTLAFILPFLNHSGPSSKVG